ncbi:hypothetical protein LIA77_01003 [Sarocladium implicatum]|nr:hypothetical protein LIA77_01003 [Sarocladium implicatum]
MSTEPGDPSATLPTTRPSDHDSSTPPNNSEHRPPIIKRKEVPQTRTDGTPGGPSIDRCPQEPRVSQNVPGHHHGKQAEESDGVPSFEAHSFASRSLLEGWLPRVRDTEQDAWRIWLSRRSRALMIQIAIIGTILLINFGLTIFAVASYGSSKGVGLVYQGKCGTVRALDLWLHLLINLMSTGLLSASNYCMQLQAAPTREDIDKAHSEGRWLDIGIPSLRNLLYLRWWRRITWGLLAFSSIPIHLIYNSAVFQSLSSHSYTVAVVKDSFLDGATWSLTTAETNRFGDPGWYDDEGLDRVNPKHWNYTEKIQMLQDDASSSSSYTRMNLSACFDLYNDYWVPQGNAVLLVSNETIQTPADDSLLMYVGVIPRSDNWAKNMWALNNGTREFTAKPPREPVKTWFVGLPKYQVRECLVQPPEQLRSECRFQYSPYIMFTVCMMNMIKAAIMLTIWIHRRRQEKEQDPMKKVIYTLGDAIASFMRNPDTHTEGQCLASQDDFRRHRDWRLREIKASERKSYPGPHPRAMNTEPYRWYSAASKRRWIILLTACILVIIVAGILLGLATVSLRHRKWETSVKGFQHFGFGALTQDTFLVLNLPRQDPEGLISNVLIANLPQLIVSVLYILYNTMLSTFLVQREFSRMHAKEYHKPLRVSEPEGIQRSSYFISLPLRFGVPLYASSGLMHWLISRSFFLARITAIDSKNQQNNLDSFSTCAYSPLAIFITMMAGICLIAVIIGMGLRQYDGTMPMVSTNSKAISAACHALEGDKREGWLLPVQWGVVSVHGGVGHCTFTSARWNTLQDAQEKILAHPERTMKYA